MMKCDLCNNEADALDEFNYCYTCHQLSHSAQIRMLNARQKFLEDSIFALASTIMKHLETSDVEKAQELQIIIDRTNRKN